MNLFTNQKQIHRHTVTKGEKWGGRIVKILGLTDTNYYI